MASSDEKVRALEIAEKWVRDAFPMEVEIRNPNNIQTGTEDGPFWNGVNATDLEAREQTLLDRAALVNRVAMRLLHGS